jgi:hypothetical protein
VEGPQFLIFNVEPAVYTTLSATGPVPIDVAFIPLRAGELTLVEMEGSGDFECSVLVSGLVRNAGNSDLGEGDVSVEAVQGDGSAINSTVTSSTAPTGSFQFSVPGRTDIFFRTIKAGFVPANTAFTQLVGDVTDASLIAIPESVAASVINTIVGFSGPWGTDHQSLGYVAMDANDGSADLATVTATDTSPGTLIFQYNEGAGTYTTTPPTAVRSVPGYPMIAAGSTTEGNYTISVTHPTFTFSEPTTLDFPLYLGEITFHEWR